MQDRGSVFVVLRVLATSRHVFGALTSAASSSSAGRRLGGSLLVALAVAILPTLSTAATSHVRLATTPAASASWMNRLNTWRASTGLSNVSENSLWSQGDYNHALYMVKNDLITHYETPGLPYYTTAGDTAARNSNILVSSTSSTTDDQAIDTWMGMPFHAIGLMDPRLTQTGFGLYREAKSGFQMGAAVDTLRGNSFTGGLYPVYFPGNGTTEPVTSYSGNESPDPLQACSGYSVPTGLPVFVQVGGNVATTAGAVHSFTANGVALQHCVIDSTDAAVGSYLTARGGVIVIPRQPLQSGVTYVVALTVNGTPYTWSFSVGPFITSVTPCTSAGLTADKSSPQIPGTVITFTATSTGCPNPQYLFYLQSPGGAWTIVRDYGGPIWTWDTSAFSGGSYVVNAWVRDAGSGVAVQANHLLPFTLGSSTPCTGAGLTSDKASPQYPGTLVTFTATSTGCSNPQYLFYLQSPGGAWTIARSYGGPIWAWEASGFSIGNYVVNAWVRDAGSGVPVQANHLLPFTLVSAVSCTGAALTSDRASPQQVDFQITFTATSAGCGNPLYLFYLQLPNGTWTIVQSYGGPTWVWDTSTVASIGSYVVNVWVTQSGSGSAVQTNFLMPFTITDRVCSAATLSSNKASPQTHGPLITFVAGSSGCARPQYLFYLHGPGLNGTWSIAQGYGSNVWVWDTSTVASIGNYVVNVWVTALGSASAVQTNFLMPFTLT